MSSFTFLFSHIDETNLCHQRLGYINFRYLTRLSRKEIIRGLPSLNQAENIIYGGCQLGKQTRAAHEKVSQIGTSRPLDLLQMDLVSPTKTKSIGGKKYFLVVVDYFLRYTWVAFLRENYEAFDEFMFSSKMMQIEKEFLIKRIKSDHGGEFENHKFSN